MKNTVDFEQNPNKDNDFEAAMVAAAEQLFGGASDPPDDSMDLGETFDADGDLIEESDEDLEEAETKSLEWSVDELESLSEADSVQATNEATPKLAALLGASKEKK